MYATTTQPIAYVVPARVSRCQRVCVGRRSVYAEHCAASVGSRSACVGRRAAFVGRRAACVGRQAAYVGLRARSARRLVSLSLVVVRVVEVWSPAANHLSASTCHVPRHDTTRHDTARYGTTWHGTARHGTTRHGAATPAVAQLMTIAKEMMSFDIVTVFLHDEEKAQLWSRWGTRLPTDVASGQYRALFLHACPVGGVAITASSR